MDKPIEINYTDNNPQEISLAFQQNEFVNREFMKAFALKKHNLAPPSVNFKPNNFFDQIYLQDDGSTGARLWLYINGIWQEFTAVI